MELFLGQDGQTQQLVPKLGVGYGTGRGAQMLARCGGEGWCTRCVGRGNGLHRCHFHRQGRSLDTGFACRTQQFRRVQAKRGGDAGGTDQKDKPCLSHIGQPYPLCQIDRQGLAQPPIERIQGLGAFGQRPKPIIERKAHGCARRGSIGRLHGQINGTPAE